MYVDAESIKFFVYILQNGFLTDSRLLDSVEEEKPASELSEVITAY